MPMLPKTARPQLQAYANTQHLFCLDPQAIAVAGVSGISDFVDATSASAVRGMWEALEALYVAKQ